METKVKVFFDPEGNTLTVWFGDPDQEHICEETDDDVILMKDRKGRVIGWSCQVNCVTDLFSCVLAPDLPREWRIG